MTPPNTPRAKFASSRVIVAAARSLLQRPGVWHSCYTHHLGAMNSECSTAALQILICISAQAVLCRCRRRISSPLLADIVRSGFPHAASLGFKPSLRATVRGSTSRGAISKAAGPELELDEHGWGGARGITVAHNRRCDDCIAAVAQDLQGQSMLFASAWGVPLSEG